jgi:transcriptional regulator with XRE-family HTH domain
MVDDELRQTRQKAGLAQEKLSCRAKIHHTYISMLEHDKKSSALEPLFRLCNALGVLRPRSG